MISIQSIYYLGLNLPLVLKKNCCNEIKTDKRKKAEIAIDSIELDRYREFVKDLTVQ